MPNPIDKAIQSIRSMNGNLYSRESNEPPVYADREKQFFGESTKAFVQARAKYATDYMSAQVQGLVPDDFYAWTTQNVRMADIIDSKSASIRIMDDHKIILFNNPAICYIPPGSKLVTMGSTWLVVNPQNVSAPTSGGIIRRCNAVWRHLDYYGNILSEPIIINKSNMLANANDEQDIVLITKGYFDVIAQYNPETVQLAQNSRIVLGSAAYAVTGYSDFTQEFTGDYNSVRLLYFSLRYEEPNDTDDMVRHVAGGLAFQWDITISGTSRLQAGMKAQLTANSTRNGLAVSSTEAFPIDYIWTSNHPEIAAVDASGLVTAVAPGTCVITASLAQNPAIVKTYAIAVEEAGGSGIDILFTTAVPDKLTPYTEAELTAEIVGGGIIDGTVKWSFTGADIASYTAATNGNTAVIHCWQGSVKPLTITASYKDMAVSVNIELIGI